MSEKTLTDFIAKDNKKLNFEERSKKFMKCLEPISKELGVLPWSKIVYTEEGIISSPMLRDLWESSPE